jgi:alkylation response protein AidB-like acyl-CoA dehydrogenase
MKFSFSDEQEEFRVFLRRFMEDKSPTTEVRRLMETDEGYDEAVWKQLSTDLGLPAVHVPEEYGGQGFGIGELAIVLEEMGRALLCAPYFLMQPPKNRNGHYCRHSPLEKIARRSLSRKKTDCGTTAAWK